MSKYIRTTDNLIFRFKLDYHPRKIGLTHHLQEPTFPIHNLIENNSHHYLTTIEENMQNQPLVKPTTSSAPWWRLKEGNNFPPWLGEAKKSADALFIHLHRKIWANGHGLGDRILHTSKQMSTPMAWVLNRTLTLIQTKTRSSLVQLRKTTLQTMSWNNFS